MTENVKKNNDVIWSKEQMVNLLHLYEQEIVKECLGDTFTGRF
jgi:hypothetical protein